MKILFFSTYFHPYTSGITTSPLLALEHLSLHHDITVFTFPHKPGLPAEEKLGRIRIVRLPYLARLSKGFIAPSLMGFFLKEVERHDAVFLNLPNFEGIAPAIAARIKGKRIVSLLNCMVDLGPGLANSIIRTGLNTSVRLQLALSGRVITYTRDYFESIPSLRAYREKTEFILPCIQETKTDKPYLGTLLKLKNKNIWVGFAGRMAQEKGMEYLIGALGGIMQRNKKIMLVAAGPGEKDVVGEAAYSRRIRTLLKKSRIPHLFLGKLTRGELAAFYSSLDVLVLPSVNRTEAFGMVQVEAMMAGTPVVASSLPGVRVPVETTRMGVAVEPGNTEKLEAAIEQVLSEKNRYCSPGRVALARSSFDIRKTFASYDRIFMEKAYEKRP